MREIGQRLLLVAVRGTQEIGPVRIEHSHLSVARSGLDNYRMLYIVNRKPTALLHLPVELPTGLREPRVHLWVARTLRRQQTLDAGERRQAPPDPGEYDRQGP